MSLPALELPKHIISLRTSGVLFAVQVKAATLTKSDNKIADRVSSEANAKTRAGKWSSDLFVNDGDLKALLNHRQAAANFENRYGLPWDGKLSYLPSPLIETCFETYKTALKPAFEADKKKFLEGYEDKVAAQAFLRGDLFNRADYPTVQELESRFSMELLVYDVPEGDFRNQVAHDLARDMQANLQRQMETIIQTMHQQQVKQIVTVMQSISHCCEIDESVGPDGEIKTRRRKIYDTTINRALELCDTLEKFNPTNDPTLEQARAGLYKALRGADAATIRESDTVREKVKAEVDDILKLFGA